MNALEVKSIRKNLGLTQANFAKKLGVDIRTVQNWEGGGVIPDSKSELLRKIQIEGLQQSSPQKNGEEAPATSSIPAKLLEELLTEARSERARLLAIVENQQQTIHDLTQEIKKENARKDDNAVCADAG